MDQETGARAERISRLAETQARLLDSVLKAGEVLRPGESPARLIIDHAKTELAAVELVLARASAGKSGIDLRHAWCRMLPARVALEAVAETELRAKGASEPAWRYTFRTVYRELVEENIRRVAGDLFPES